LDLRVPVRLKARQRYSTARLHGALNCRPNVRRPEADVLNAVTVLLEKVEMRCASFEHLDQFKRKPGAASERDLQPCIRAARIERHFRYVKLMRSPAVDTEHALIGLRDRL
jgi:hypothetical protein